MSTSKNTNGCFVRAFNQLRIPDGYLHAIAFVLTFPIQVLVLLKTMVVYDSVRKVMYANFGLFEQTIDRNAIVQCHSKLKKPMTIVAISDTHNLHGHLSPLPEGDVLIHTGDCSCWGTLNEMKAFADWYASQSHKIKIFVPGNHDMLMDEGYYADYWRDWNVTKESTKVIYDYMDKLGIIVLCDRSVEINGLVFHGSPWCLQRDPWKTAFTCNAERIQKKWSALPRDVDILLTHSPCHTIGDRCSLGGKSQGCPELKRVVLEEVRPMLHIFGHEHGDPGFFAAGETTFCNASSVSDVLYNLRKPMVLEIVSGMESRASNSNKKQTGGSKRPRSKTPTQKRRRRTKG